MCSYCGDSGVYGVPPPAPGARKEHVCTYACAANDCEKVVGPAPPGARKEGGHSWITERHDWQVCERCGIVKRLDGENRPCPGIVQVTPREATPAAVPQVKDDGIYERIGGEFYEIGDPEDCDACAKLDDLERDVPICYLHRTPQRCGDCADHPILKCPTCDIPSAVADAVREELGWITDTVGYLKEPGDETWNRALNAVLESLAVRARSRDGG